MAAAAEAHPELNFLALEVYDPGVAHTLLLAGKRGLRNLRIAQVNAPELMKAVAPGVVSEVWTFFPDPWPKMKHHKRRIVQPELAADVRRALADGGVWRIATDIEDYALHVHEVMDGRDDFANAGALTVSLPTEHVGKGNAADAAGLPHADFTESERFEGRVLTNFEKKGLAAGRVIHDFTYRTRWLCATRRDLRALTSRVLLSELSGPLRLTVRTPDFQSDNESSTLSGGTTYNPWNHNDPKGFLLPGNDTVTTHETQRESSDNKCPASRYWFHAAAVGV